MRPKRQIFTLSAADDNGYLDDATGVGPWATLLAQPADGTGHQITITSGSDLSTKTFILLGTDAEGRSLSETVTGPNATVVTSVGYFKTLTSVTASATIGAATMDIGWAGTARTPTYPVSVYVHGAAAMGINVGGTINYIAQQTNDAIYDNNPAQWRTLGEANSDHDQILEAADGCSAMRVDIVSHTNGILYITHSQARV